MVFRLQKCLNLRELSSNFAQLSNLVEVNLEQCPFEDKDFSPSFGLLKKPWTLPYANEQDEQASQLLQGIDKLADLNMQLSRNLVHVHTLAGVPSRA